MVASDACGNVDRPREDDDANNILYRFESSFDFDVEPALERITAPLLTILFADDELNPPELGTMERVMKRLKKGRMVLVRRAHRPRAIARR